MFTDQHLSFFLLQESRSGYTPLHIAVELNHVLLTKFLLKECKKIDIEAVTYRQLTAYQMATDYEHREIMTLLESFDCERLPPPESDSYDSDDSLESGDDV